jgi:protoporphyrin/coproporphyrin ferrochelatase
MLKSWSAGFRNIQKSPSLANMTDGAKAERTAVLLLAHGSPDSPEEVPEFLSRVTGGRRLPPELVEEVRHRYQAIGRSPLTQITLRQGELLAKKLGIPVYVGMRNWRPLIGDTLERLIADGIHRAIVICMAPQNSRTSVGLYRASLRLSVASPLIFEFVDSWYDQPLLIQAFVENLEQGRQRAQREAGAELPVIFTAHSVPERTIVEGDPYAIQAKQTAELVAAAAAVPRNDWHFAYQSQGLSGGSWLGPTVESVIADLAARGHLGVFIQPVGFVCDHVEVLYDIDIGFRQFAAKAGMRLWRAQSLNDSPLLIAALAAIASSRLRATSDLRAL